jgi:hypothetical protein
MQVKRQYVPNAQIENDQHHDAQHDAISSASTFAPIADRRA